MTVAVAGDAGRVALVEPLGFALPERLAAADEIRKAYPLGRPQLDHHVGISLLHRDLALVE